MTTVYRPETCSDCGEEREREWIVKTISKGTKVPKGYRVVKSDTEFWKTIEGRTRWTTLCLCDVP